MKTLPSEFTDQADSLTNFPVFLFEIQTDKSGSLWRVCKSNVDITWKGNVYTAYDIQTGGLGESIEGESPSFDITISNIDRIAGGYILKKTTTTIYGLRDMPVRVILLFLTKDPATNMYVPLSDNDSFVDFHYHVSGSEFKASGKNRECVLHCKSKMFTEVAQIPARTIGRHICWWEYRSRLGCKYSGANILSPIIYNTGTVSIVDTSSTVTGSGTAWLGKIAGGDVLQSTFMAIYLGGQWRPIGAVTTNTSLELVTAFSGVNIVGASYEVRYADFCSKSLDDINYGCKAHRNTNNFGAFPGIPDSPQIRY